MRHFSVSILLLLLAGAAVYAQTAPNSSDKYVMRGLQRASKGDLDGAIADYTRVIELDHRMLAHMPTAALRGKKKAIMRER